MELLPPLDFGWPWKPLSSAGTSITKTPNGSLEVTIEHEVISGITSQMLEWWFQNLDRDVRYRGQTVHAYRLWHPRDHLRVSFTRDAAGRVSPGQRVHIREMFARDPRFAVEEHAFLHRWDRYGVGLHVETAGQRIFELNHQFDDVPGGVQYRTRARVGAFRGALGALLNRVFVPHRFSAEKAQAWLTHNVEEVGCFEHFLPELFAAASVTPRAEAAQPV
jgi:hypothetical protein